MLDSLPEFLETLKLLHIAGPLSGRGICSVSCSGGEASLAADAAKPRNLFFPALTRNDETRIAATLNEYVAITNPLDYHTFIWGDQQQLTDCFTAVMASNFDLTMFIFDFPRADRCSAEDWGPATAAIKEAARRSGNKAAAVASLPENMPEAAALDFAAAGIVSLYGINEAMAAAEAAATCGEMRGTAPPPMTPQTPPAPKQPRILDEAEGKAQLSQAGIAVPRGVRVDTAAETAIAAATLSTPLAVKRLGVAHKTEEAAVALSLSASEVEAVAAGMGPGPYLVEEMVQNPVAELILGVTRDPAYGLTLTVGTGGVTAELLKDIVTLLPPINAASAKEAILSLRLAPLLTGYRGRPKADVDAAAAAVAALSVYVESHAATLDELDINPLIVTTTGAYAADALIRIRE